MPAYDVLVLNSIAAVGLKRLPAERYRVGKDVARPHAILVRSADMHAMELPDSVLAIGRAGAGTNNIPVQALSRQRECGEGAGARRHAHGRAQHSGGAGIRARARRRR
jgi:phosphoglycerate dehydrogenase-like enzyme